MADKTQEQTITRRDNQLTEGAALKSKKTRSYNIPLSENILHSGLLQKITGDADGGTL